MTTVMGFIRRHPVAGYLLLTFVLSWGSLLLVIGGPGALPGTREETDRLFPIAVMAMLVGPVVSGPLLTGLVHGKAGLREFGSRMVRWRADALSYAIALLAAPLAGTVVSSALSLASPSFRPGLLAAGETAPILVTGIAVGLAAGVFEELGWTGFAIPELRSHRGILATGFIVGSLWGAWHLLVNVWASREYAGAIPPAVYLPATLLGLLAGSLPAFRVLMVWVYDRTGSLLVAMLMHASLTFTTLVLRPLEISGGSALVYDLAWSVTMWAAVAAIVRAGPRPVSRP